MDLNLLTGAIATKRGLRTMQTTKKTRAPEFKMMLLDAQVPWDVKRQHIAVMLAEDEAQPVLQEVLALAASAAADSVAESKLREVNELIRSLQDGPLRPATFVDLLPAAGLVQRAHVKAEDGHSAFVVITGKGLADTLRRGQRVLLDAKMLTLIAIDPTVDGTGEVGRLVRRIGKDLVQLSFHGEETHQFLASAKLADDLERGAAAPGAQVLACRRRGIAFEALPPADGLSHYRYLSRKPVPDVVVSRDLGAAPAFVEELAEHTRMLLFQPDLMRTFHVRPVRMKMLAGVAGAGKSYAILAFWRLFYEIMSEAAGVPAESLPPRVLELRASTILNKYLGESDKQIDRFFDEVEQLASVEFEAPDGRKIQLPVLVIIEECDAIARTRGGGETDAVHDRIQTTLLQRFDPTNPRLRDKPVIFICTTNAPALCDPAFVRRGGGTIERFGRLTRTACRQVLARHVRGLPFQTHNGHRPEDLERDAVAQVTAWLFCPESADQPLAEVTYVGTAAPVSKYRKDFLTPALIDRAVQQAASEACRNARRGDAGQAGLAVRDVAAAIDQQVRSVVEQLSRENIANYVDLPDGVRVAAVRRIDRPAVFPFDLMRAS